MLDLKVVAKEVLGLDTVEMEKDVVTVISGSQELLAKYSNVVKAKYSDKGAILSKVAEILAKNIPDEKFVAIIVGKLPSWLSWLSFVISPLVVKAKAVIIREILEAIVASTKK